MRLFESGTPALALLVVMVLGTTALGAAGCGQTVDVSTPTTASQVATAAMSDSPPSAEEASALKRVKESFAPTASVALQRDDSTWLAPKSPGIVFVVRVVEEGLTADFIFAKALRPGDAPQLAAIAFRSAGGNVKVVDRLSLPRTANLKDVLTEVRGAR